MLLWFFLIAGSPDIQPLWEITETGIYAPIDHANIGVVDDGRIFLLNSREAQVQVYTKEGEQLHVFGKKGDGPGEFTFPYTLHVNEQGLYVRDLGKSVLHKFDLDGAFVRRLSLGSRIFSMQLVKNGWIYGNWQMFGKNKDPGQVIMVDANFENPQVVVNLRPQGFKKSEKQEVFRIGDPIKHNPAPDVPHIAGDPNGNIIWFYHPGSKFKLSVIDTQSGDVVKTITRDWKLLPFDEDWGNAYIKERNEAKRKGFQLKLLPDFPEHFPHISNMVWRDGQYYLSRWTGDPEKRLLAVIDGTGKDIATTLTTEETNRSLPYNEDYVLVFNFDEESGEAGLALVATKDATAYMEANPLGEYEVGGGFVLTK